MSTIYVDSAATQMGGTSREGDVRDALSPDAVEALRILRDGGHQLLFIEGPEGLPLELRDLGQVVSEIPEDDHAPAWFITGDLARCASPRPGLTTVLVGPSTGGAASVVRCDVSARDLRAASMEILAREAMPPRSPGGGGRHAAETVQGESASST